MPRLKVNNYIFYRELEVSKEEIRYDSWRAGSFNKENLIKDIEEEFRVNGASDKVPPFQTKVNLYDRMKDKTHWSDLYKKIRHTLMRHYTKEFVLKESWANKAVENSAFGFHTHDFEKVSGINDKFQLAQAEKYFQTLQRKKLLSNGATLLDMDSIFIRGEVDIQKDVTFDANVIIEGKVIIGENVQIQSLKKTISNHDPKKFLPLHRMFCVYRSRSLTYQKHGRFQHLLNHSHTGLKKFQNLG